MKHERAKGLTKSVKVTGRELRYKQSAIVTEKEKRFYSYALSEGCTLDELIRFARGRTLCEKLLSRGMQVLAYEDLDAFIEKYGDLMDDIGRNTLWQNNHLKVLAAISNLTLQKNRFPTRSEISTETSLSQQTINKHLKNYFASKEYEEKREELILLRERVLAGMFTRAIDGDAKAARVFLTATSIFVEPQTPKTQNNFIQVNGVVITQECLQHLPIGKLNQIQKILSFTPHKQPR